MRFLTALFTALLLNTVFLEPLDARTGSGANFGWFQLQGCDRSPFYILQSSVDDTPTILRELREIQVRIGSTLRIPVYFDLRGGKGILKSANGLALADQRRYATIIDLAKQEGFKQIIVGFFPLAESFAANWKIWEQDIYEKNLLFIKQVINTTPDNRNVLFDLGNEHVPEQSQEMLLHYSQNLLHDVREAAPQVKLGFSAIGTPSRIAQLNKVFNAATPDFFDFHIYDNAQQALEALRENSYYNRKSKVPTIIGETFADKNYVSEIDSASKRLNLNIQTIIQWPLSRARRCKDVDTVF